MKLVFGSVHINVHSRPILLEKAMDFHRADVMYGERPMFDQKADFCRANCDTNYRVNLNGKKAPTNFNLNAFLVTSVEVIAIEKNTNEEGVTDYISSNIWTAI